ncbi:BPSS1780 family membrane protein [Undibacterium sp.]|uniref:BPSS1780 family membrane protein n=1 Tax=Undibacterium sp. TaxID=1914977 RepID=UPI003752886D
MNTINAVSGGLWIRHAVQLFRKKPFEVLFSFMGFVFCLLGMLAIPQIGIVFFMMLAPVLNMGFMHVCRDVDENQAFTPRALFVGFRTPVFKPLCLLGLLQLLALLLSFLLVMAVDGGVIWDFMSNGRMINEKALLETKVGTSLLLARLFYFPAMMALWFAAPLIMWHGMSVGKAIFYSFFAVWRARVAFITYFIVWIGILFFVPVVLGLIASLIPGVIGVLNLLLIPILLVVLVVLHCSFYTSYKEIFARDDLA